MKPGRDVLGFGAVAVDDVVTVDRFPEPGTKTRAAGRRRMTGGLAGTALATAAKLGCATGWAGVLGDDAEAAFALTALREAGVDLAEVLRTPGARPHASVILVDATTGNRTVISDRTGVTPRPPDAVTPELIGSAKVVLVDHTAPMLMRRVAELARAARIPVVGDLESLTDPANRDVLDLCDHLIVGTAFATELTGGDPNPIAQVRILAGTPGRTMAAVTDGERGCWWAPGSSPADVRYVPAFPVDAVDTTGCGDVFHGAYAAELARGSDPDDALHLASAAAAVKATRSGGWPALPSRDDLRPLIGR